MPLNVNFGYGGGPVIARLISQVAWTGEDLTQPPRALASELEQLGFSRLHAYSLVRSIEQGIKRKEVRSFGEPVVGYLVLS